MFRWGNQIQTIPVTWVGWKTHPIIIISAVGDRTNDLPYTVASNMVKVSHALNHSATAELDWLFLEALLEVLIRSIEVVLSRTNAHFQAPENLLQFLDPELHL